MSSFVLETDLVGLLRELVAIEGTQRAAARRLGISEQYLSDVLGGHRAPGRGLLRALQHRKVVVYERI